MSNGNLIGAGIGSLLALSALLPTPTPDTQTAPIQTPAANMGSVQIIAGNGFYWLQGYFYQPGNPPQLPQVPVDAGGVVYDAAGLCIGRFENQRFVFLDADSQQCVGIPPAPNVVYSEARG